MTVPATDAARRRALIVEAALAVTALLARQLAVLAGDPPTPLIVAVNLLPPWAVFALLHTLAAGRAPRRVLLGSALAGALLIAVALATGLGDVDEPVFFSPLLLIYPGGGLLLSAALLLMPPPRP